MFEHFVFATPKFKHDFSLLSLKVCSAFFFSFFFQFSAAFMTSGSRADGFNMPSKKRFLKNVKWYQRSRL
jgi:hypothetical protein